MGLRGRPPAKSLGFGVPSLRAALGVDLEAETPPGSALGPCSDPGLPGAPKLGTLGVLLGWHQCSETPR